MLEVRDIHKSFGSQTALSSVCLSVRKGEFFSLLGPSGCGKSTLLRILAGLEQATSGEILWDGRRIDHLAARERPFNMVFQKYALFPHMTVFENVAFGLRLKKVSGQDIKKRVDEVLNLVNMASFSERRPETLSGGQAQRVALARALVNEPDCVLLDEPLGALDQKLREHMQTELRLLQRRLGLTFIFVTHDQEEAMLLSDRIAVMNDGHVEQVSEPRALYEIPQSIFCARFVGRRNEFDGYVLDRDGDLISVQVGARQRLKGRSVCQALDSEGGGLIRAFVRPEVLRPVPRTASPTPGYNVIEGEVVQILFRGLKLEVAIGVGGDQIMRSLLDVDPETMSLRVGDRLGFEFSPSETHLFLSRAQ